MIHALPGMGADARMYPAPWTDVPGFVAIPWIRHSGERTLREVAVSMCVAHGIRDGDDLIGSSLGGMVACEISKIRRVRRLFLIGSAIRKEEINPILSALRPMMCVAPLGWLRASAGMVPLELCQMFGDTESSFLRSMCEAAFQWEGLGCTETAVYRIHGEFDRVIPPPPGVDLLLDGGHLVAMTHARECAEFVRSHTVGTDVPPGAH